MHFMHMQHLHRAIVGALLGAAFFSSTALAASADKAAQQKPAPIVIEEQGSFAVGGKSLSHDGTFSAKNFLSADGQKAYGDHAYVFYQIPEHANTYPIVFQHGGAQSKRTWETTMDGREGFQNIFLRKGYGVYLLDQPRSGEASLSTEPLNPEDTWGRNPMYADKTFWLLCRVGNFPDGVHPETWPGSQFPNDETSYDQFQRSWTIGGGALDNDVNADALAALLEKTGPAILMTHSMGGTVGWRVPYRTENVKAIVALEPGGTPFLFPENEMPEPEHATFAPLSATAQGIPADDFDKLAKIPMLLIYGDNIADQPTAEVGTDKWRTEFSMAKKFAAVINRHGGNATILHLPDIGIIGNTHFLMSDKNNTVIADLIEDWLEKHVK